ncbi:MAG: hypothetical protein U0326_30415 [Polyangiales bacterium]
MAKAQSPLLGYNTNVRHKGRVFHIQTEDSGIARPHVITHLFADGGRVLKTAKTSYAELVALDDVQVRVKKLMQDQHKAMFIALRDGQFDAQFEVPATPATAPEAPPPAAAAADLLEETPTLAAPPPQPLVAVPREAFDLESVNDDDGAIEIDESAFIEPTESFINLDEMPTPEPVVEPPPPPASPPPALVPPPVRPSKVSGPWVAAPRLPTPAAATASASSKPPPLRAAPARTQPPAIRVPAVAPTPPARAPLVSALQPAKTPAPATRSATGFGERLVTERSLDEVILAYLAEELDEPRNR